MNRPGPRKALLLTAVALGCAIAAYVVFRSDRGSAPGDSAVEPRQPYATPLAASAATPQAPPLETPATGVRFSPLDPSQAGTGAVRLRVIRAATGEPIVGASVVLHGTGHGGEVVRLGVATGPDGEAALADVPAGPWMTLHVEARGLPAMDRADVDVVRDRTLDLGDVALVAGRTVRVRALDDRLSAVGGAVVEVHTLEFAQTRAMLPGYSRFLPSLLQHLPAPAVATTDSQGLALVEAVRPGRVLVSAHRTGRVTARTIVHVPREVDPDLPDLILREGLAVAGRVVDAAGEPVGGALLVATDPHRGIDMEDDPPRWGRAEASGRFELRVPDHALPGGLWVWSAGRPATWVDVGAAQDDLRVVLPDGVPFELVAVHEATATPVPDAAVEIVVIRSDSPGEPPWTWTATTDDAGRLVTTLPRGRLDQLSVRSARFVHAHGPDRGSYDAYLTQIPSPTELVPNHPVGLVARLRPWPYWPLDGRVVDEHGRPIPDAVVSTTSWGPPEPAARADGSGWFEDVVDARDGFPGASTWLRVLSPGWVVVGPWAEVHRDDPRRRASVTVTVHPSATIRGRVLASDGTGLPNVDVSWTGPAHGHGAGGRTTTRRDGTFVLVDLETTGPRGDRGGSGRVHLAAEGFLPVWSPGFTLIPGRTADVGLLVMSRGATVTGRILDPGGAPAAGVRVGVYPAGWITPPGLAREDIRFALTDAAGRFEITGVPPRAWLLAEPRNATEVRASMTVTEPDEAPQSPVTLRLSRGSPLVGTVVDERGAPCEASVVFRRRAQDATPADEHELEPVRTDRLGRFRLASVPLGPATLTACTSERLGTAEVDAAAGTTVRVVIEPSADAWPTAIGLFRERIPRHPHDTSR